MTENEREIAMTYSTLLNAQHQIEHAGRLTDWEYDSIKDALHSIEKATKEFEQKIDETTDWTPEV